MFDTATVLEGLPGDKGAWSVATLALLRYIQHAPGHVTLRMLAIRLSNAPDTPTAAQVFTPAKSESAFILAAALARASLTQWTIWLGHVANLHMVRGARAGVKGGVGCGHLNLQQTTL